MNAPLSFGKQSVVLVVFGAFGIASPNLAPKSPNLAQQLAAFGPWHNL